MLKKELLELCLLQLLLECDRYGYELLQTINKGFPGTQESAVYAILRGLCRDGYTECYQGEVSDGPVRKYYRLTPAGRVKHMELLSEWRTLHDAMTALGLP